MEEEGSYNSYEKGNDMKMVKKKNACKMRQKKK